MLSDPEQRADIEDSSRLEDAPPFGWRHGINAAPAIEATRGLILLGRHVRRARYFAGKSQDRLADDSGVSQAMISRLELARAPAMRVDRLVLLGERLGRTFPLGFCPHEHHCAWQPVELRPPPDPERERLRELLIRHGLDSRFRPANASG